MALHDKAYYRSHPRVDFSLAAATSPEAITYKLFKKEHPENYNVLTADNFEQHQLDKSVKTVLLIHGWTSSDKSPWYHLLKTTYFEHGDYNIIYIDWSTYGNMSYRVSSANVKPVGDYIATFLVKSGIPPNQIHLVGHSLGAQLSGFIGKSYEKQLGVKIGRITALDPAGPQWMHEHMNNEERLCHSDAAFVDVNHTDIHKYGYTYPCGHVDFYPNGGTDQPGCPNEEQDGNCNHRRSTLLFIESIYIETTASEIDITEDEHHNIIIRHKKASRTVIFGEHINPTVKGVFYFETGPVAPFLKTSI